MKKFAHILSMLLLLAGCSEKPLAEMAPDSTCSVLPQNICVNFAAEPMTKLSLGQLNPTTGRYPLSFEYGDHIYVVGISGDKLEYDGSKLVGQQFYAYYRTEKVTFDKTMFILSSSYSGDISMEEAYAASNTILLLSDLADNFDMIEYAARRNATVTSRLLYGNKFTKDAFEAAVRPWRDIFDSVDVPDDDALPVKVLTSMLDVKFDLSGLEDNYILTSLNIGYRYSLACDMSRIDDMFRDWTYYAKPSRSGNLSIGINYVQVGPGSTPEYLVPLAPGLSELHVGAYFNDYHTGAFQYYVARELNNPYEFKPGVVYEITLKPTEYSLQKSAYYNPFIEVGGYGYHYSDPDDSDVSYMRNRFGLEGCLHAGRKVVAVEGYGEPADFPASMAGNIALIRRGNISFVDKINNARNAGAVAVIIANNEDDPVSMDISALTDWIPTISVPQSFLSKFNESTDRTVTLGSLEEFWSQHFLFIGNVKYPLYGNMCATRSPDECIAAVKGLLAEAVPVVVVPGNDFSKVDVAGKIALPEFVPMEGKRCAQAAQAAGASALILPGSNAFGRRTDCIDFSSNPDITIPVVTTQGSFPFCWMALGYRGIGIDAPVDDGPCELDLDKVNTDDWFN